MSSFFGCLFVLLFAVVFIFIAFIGQVADMIFTFLGLKKRVNNDRSGFGGFSGNGTQQQRQQQRTSDRQQPNGNHPKGKIFEKDDSEYVDFEEV